MSSSEERLRERLLEKQNRALRDPAEVITGNPSGAGIHAKSLEYSVTGDFIALLEKLNITLLVTREYEHLVMAYRTVKGKLHQSFLHLPHPAGIAVDRKKNFVYVAATRNPNAIVELAIQKEISRKKKNGSLLVPSRVKYFPGSTYLHDLAFVGKELYANSVGQNGIIKVDMNSPTTGNVCWMPSCVRGKNDRNHIQLNSIAAGGTLAESYFSASAETVTKFKPGDLKFPVDKKGVIFSGKTKRAVARGLTRPHSAKLYRGKLWVNNSGYGEFGFIRSGSFIPLVQMPGWTRGLCFSGDVAFVGVSRIIKKFKAYAPGISVSKPVCAVYAVNIHTGKILGSIRSQYGNQIFGIDFLPSSACQGFPFRKLSTGDDEIRAAFFRYSV
jgi:uncharacterized protein (TIGR03032 family)